MSLPLSISVSQDLQKKQHGDSDRGIIKESFSADYRGSVFTFTDCKFYNLNLGPRQLLVEVAMSKETTVDGSEIWLTTENFSNPVTLEIMG